MASQQLLYILAIVFFVLAAVPHGLSVRFEWLAFAALVASQLVH